MEKLNTIGRKVLISTIFALLSVYASAQTSFDSALLLCAKQNKFHRLKHLIHRNVNLNLTDKKGTTILLWSVYHNNYKMLNYLIEHKATFVPNSFIRKDNSNLTFSEALSIAAYNNDTAMASLLLKNFHLDIDARNYDVASLSASGATALSFAITNKADLMFDYLINKGADINLVNFLDGNTPLIETVINNNYYAFTSLVSSGAKLNIQNNKGQTALHIALANNFTSFAKLLIDKGAKINISDNQGFTPIMYSVANYNFELTRLLINKGAKINKVNKFGLQAIDYVEKSIDSNFYDFVYLNTLSAIKLYSASYFEFLENKIQQGLIDINKQDMNGETLLHIAIKEEDYSMVKFLIAKGVNLNLMDDNFRTAFDLARISKNPDLMKLLKESGVKESYEHFSPEIRQKYLLNRNKYRTFGNILATTYNSNQIDSIIVSTNILSVKDKNGNNIMHIAIYRNRTDIVKKLLLHNFSGDIPNNRGETPLNVAMSMNNNLVVRYFKQFGIKQHRVILSAISADSLLVDYKSGNINGIKKLMLSHKQILNLPSFNGISLNEKIVNDKAESLLNFMIYSGITPTIVSNRKISPFIDRKLHFSGVYNQVLFDFNIKKINDKAKLTGLKGNLFSILPSQF